MRSLESRRNRALDDVSDNKHLKKSLEKKMGNAGPLRYNDQAEDVMQILEEMETFSERDAEASENDQAEAAMFSERDAGKATIDVATKEKKEIEEDMKEAQKQLDDLVRRAGSIKRRRGELRDSREI